MIRPIVSRQAWQICLNRSLRAIRRRRLIGPARMGRPALDLRALRWGLFARLLLLAPLLLQTSGNATAQEPDELSVEQLVQQLRSGDLQTRRDAALALSERGEKAVVATDALVQSLDERDPQIWAQAVAALAAIGPEASAAVPRLLELLDTSDPQRGYRLAYALARVGAGDLDAWMGHLHDANPRRQLGVVRALAFLQGDAARAVDELAKLVATADADLAQAAADTLWQIGTASVEPLLQLLSDAPLDRRVLAARALTRIRPLPTGASTRLIGALSQEDPSVRAAVVQSLGTLVARPADRDESVAEARMAIVRALADPNEQVAQAGITAIVRNRLFGKDMLDGLVKALDRETDTASLAAYAIGRIGPPAIDALPALLGRISGPEPVSSAVQNAVARMGPGAIAPLEEGVAQGTVRSALAARVAVAMGPPVRSHIGSPAAAKSGQVAVFRARTLIGLRPEDEATVGQVADLLEHVDSQLRIAAAEALSLLDASAARPARDRLVLTARDPDPSVRAAAIGTLTQLWPDDPRTQEVVSGALSDEDGFVRSAAAEALAAVAKAPPEEAIGPLTQLLRADSATLRAAALSVLGRTGDARVAKDILPLVSDPDTTVQAAAIVALGHLSLAADQSLPVLEAIAKRTGDPAQAVAIEALGQLGSAAHRTTDTLARLALDSQQSEAVRKLAIETLPRVGPSDQGAVDLFVKALDDPQWSVRQAAAVQLGRIGAPATRAVPGLLQRLENSQDRDFAANAIRQIDAAPPEAVPLLMKMLENPRSDRRVRYYALHLLRKAGPAAKQALPLLYEQREDATGREREFLDRAVRDLEAIDGP